MYLVKPEPWGLALWNIARTVVKGKKTKQGQEPDTVHETKQQIGADKIPDSNGMLLIGRPFTQGESRQLTLGFSIDVETSG